MLFLTIILIALFLPLFPFSMVFNALFTRLTHPVVRLLMLLIWPQIGLMLAVVLAVELPIWISYWALATAILYAFRLIALRELAVWVAFLATSCWSLLWIFLLAATEKTMLVYYALGFSTALLLFPLLIIALEKRFGVAYTSLYDGLGMSMPRFSAILVFVVLAAIATPIFPAFFVMLQVVIAASLPVMVGILLVWLLWSWAATRLLAGLIIGDKQQSIDDFSALTAAYYVLALMLMLIAGLYWLGGSI